MNFLQTIYDNAFADIASSREAFTPALALREIGTITSVATGIAKVSGLPNVGYEELVRFPGDVYGIASNVDQDEIGVALLGDYSRLHAGDEVQRTGRVTDVAVGDGLLGRVIDPTGRPLDGNGIVRCNQRLPIERPAAPIMDRDPVTVPLQTGIKVINALIPIGRGQRELILGDRQTGKTAIALDTIINQRGQNTICVYCAIGQRASAVAKAVAVLEEYGAMEFTVVVVSEGNDPPGLAYIAPYAATSIAEYYQAVELGLSACFQKDGRVTPLPQAFNAVKPTITSAIVFGSDNGLVGQFNDVITEFAVNQLSDAPGELKVWSVGERVHGKLVDSGLPLQGQFPVPSSVNGIATLVGHIQIECFGGHREHESTSVFVFHNRPQAKSLYEPVSQRLLPLDSAWRQRLSELPWPTHSHPELLGGHRMTLQSLIHEYLFISTYRACAESLASENASRLAAMQRADKNIDELLETLHIKSHRQRQGRIDEELFDVVSGFDALSS